MTATRFAPAERAPEMRVHDLHQLLSGIPLLKKILCSVPDVLLFLNKQRQIVFANDAAYCFLGIEPSPELFGIRPGDAIAQCRGTAILRDATPGYDLAMGQQSD